MSSVKVTVFSSIDSTTEQVENLYIQKVLTYINKVSNTFQENIQRSMVNSPATGNTYTSGVNENITHIASSEGNPPRPDTGNLKNSIMPFRARRVGDVISGGVDTEMEYAYSLDKGRLNRPFMREGSIAFEQTKRMANGRAVEIRIGNTVIRKRRKKISGVEFG